MCEDVTGSPASALLSGGLISDIQELERVATWVRHFECDAEWWRVLDRLVKSLRHRMTSREHVAWCKFTKWGDGRVTIRTCDSDDDGAFPVFRESR